MKKISLLSLIVGALFAVNAADAAYDNDRFREEVRRGVDVVSATSTAYTTANDAYGELGIDVYEKQSTADLPELGLYIPSDMYMRGGAGMNLGFASGMAEIYGTDVEQSGGWNVQIGLGWNLSSYVRTEIDFQYHNFEFSKHEDLIASARQVGGTLYFDFARRYVHTGDITRRRTLVPFMGLGAGIGSYKFAGAGGAEGVFIAPRGVLGLNVMFNDLIGVDLAYQYQIFAGDGFGWDAPHGGVMGISDIMLSFRVNF